MFQTEKDFGKAVMAAFKKAGFTCIRIESASTISGMPDLYVMGHGDDYFIELKNVKTKPKLPGTYKVAWRPGQQGWAATYKMLHTKNKIAKHSWTVQAFDGEIHCIRMEHPFEADTPDNKCIIVVSKPIDIIRTIMLNTYVEV